MNVFNTLVVLALLCVGVVLLVPIVSFAVAVAIVLGCAFLWLLPILIIANSDRTTGGEKLLWILAIIFLSWFAWILYFLVAPIRPRPRYYY
ncbi:MAG TPA: PLDc N-terminal domain-containing protein [Pseudomonadales bacterium]